MDTTQAELDAIQRRFRDMEAKHRLSNDDSIQTIRMQRSKIDKLKTDNERLKEELALETRQAKMSMTSGSGHSSMGSTMSKTSNLDHGESGEMYLRKIEIEKKRIAELDLQIKKMEESILQQRSDMGGINANRETSKTIQKNIRMLENRLDKALVKYNEALGHNKKLRETIDNLRRERIVFDGIYKKLEGDLIAIKNEMSAIIHEANAAYIARDYAQSEMLRLKAEADGEQKQFENEWKELTKLIDQDQKMKDFLINKDRENMNDAVVTSVLEQEQNLRKKLSKGAWQIVKDKAHIHMAQEKVKSYKDSFDKISNATGIEDIDMLVNTFIAAEQQNFKLFNQVNKLSNEIERIEEQIANTQRDIELITGEDEEEVMGGAEVGSDEEKELEVDTGKTKEEADDEDVEEAVAGGLGNQRQVILRELKNKIKSTEMMTTRYKNEYQESLRTMSSLKDGISSILGKIGIDQNNKAMMDMLKNTGVTESNVMEILGVIEQKTNDLINRYQTVSTAAGGVGASGDKDILATGSAASGQSKDHSNKQLDDKQAEAASLGIGIGASSLQPLVAIPASIFDDFSDDEDDNDDDNNQIFAQEPMMHKAHDKK